ncbi:hypothetical protein ACP275_06G168300 [Erythranthe tilingii]
MASSSDQRKITLRSSEGELFEISESAAVLSNTLKNKCSIPLQDIRSKTLKDVIAYLKEHARASVSDEKKRKFDKKFVSDKDIQVLFDIIMAADHLNIKGLQEIVTEKINKIMTEDKNVEEPAKKTWGIKWKSFLTRNKNRGKVEVVKPSGSKVGLLKMLMKSKFEFGF